MLHSTRSVNANSYEFLELRFDFANLQFIPTAFTFLSLRALRMSDKLRDKFPVVYIRRLYFTTFTTVLKLHGKISFIVHPLLNWTLHVDPHRIIIRHAGDRVDPGQLNIVDIRIAKAFLNTVIK